MDEVLANALEDPDKLELVLAEGNKGEARESVQPSA